MVQEKKDLSSTPSTYIDGSEAIETYEKTYSKVLHFISHKMRSEKEVSDKLNILLPGENFHKVKEKIISDLKDKNYIGDLDYAEEYVRQISSSRKPCSLRKMKYFLMRKGVTRDVTNTAFRFIPPQFEYKNALKETKKKLRLTVGVEGFVKKKKIMDFLYKKGYLPSTVSRVVDTLL